jgi:glycosyltransferase involved in cell wall biosynthesis
MRIGIDARMFHKAGIRRYATELIRNLSQIDTSNHYTLYVSAHGQPEGMDDLAPNFRLEYLDGPLFSVREHLLFIHRLRRDRQDLLHTTFDFGVPLWPGSKVIVTVHDAFFGPCTFFRNFKTRVLYQILTRYSVARASRILVISNFIKDKLLRHIPRAGHNARRISVIPNGVGSEFVPGSTGDETERVKKEYGIRNKYILCVGSFASGIKNLPGILEAFALLPGRLRDQYQLVIAGELLDRVPETSDAITALKGKNQVLCPGYVPDGDLPELYRNAEFFVFPSFHEGFGIPVLEAMACGTPVITSDSAAMPEIAGDAAILVNPYDAHEISRAMTEVCSQENLRRHLSRKGLERARHYSWSKTAQKTLAVYEELADTHRSMIAH